jgi:hypothetical protein
VRGRLRLFRHGRARWQRMADSGCRTQPPRWHTLLGEVGGGGGSLCNAWCRTDTTSQPQLADSEFLKRVSPSAQRVKFTALPGHAAQVLPHALQTCHTYACCCSSCTVPAAAASRAAVARLQLALWCFQCCLAHAGPQYLQAAGRRNRVCMPASTPS